MEIPVSGAVTRRQLVVAGVIVGLMMAIALGGVVWIALTVNTFQQQEIRRNSEGIKRLDRITQELRRLTHPTKAEYKAQLREGFRRCAAEPECREILRRLLEPRAGGAAAPRSAPFRPDPGARTGPGARAPLRQRGIAVSHPSRPAATTNPPRRHSKPAGGSAPPPQSSGESSGAAITLTAPLPVAVCRPPLVRVNCA